MRKQGKGRIAVDGWIETDDWFRTVVANTEPDDPIVLAFRNRTLRGYSVQVALRTVPETSAINSPLSKARRLFRSDTPDREEAAKLLAQSLERFAEEVAWRLEAAERLGAPLNAYNAAIADTIGLRLQERLSTEQAADIAACLSHHRDISLDF